MLSICSNSNHHRPHIVESVVVYQQIARDSYRAYSSMDDKNDASTCRSTCLLKNVGASPNKQTRATRKRTGIGVSDSYYEREQVAKVCRNFKHRKYKPCSVFGLDRVERYRGGFFFCLNCHFADTREQNDSKHPINRFSGLYKCQAKHTDIIFPTDRMIDKKRRKQTAQPQATTSSEAPEPANPKPPPPLENDLEKPQPKKRRGKLKLTNRKKSKVTKPPPQASSQSNETEPEPEPEVVDKESSEESDDDDNDSSIGQVDPITYIDKMTQTDPVSISSNNVQTNDQDLSSRESQVSHQNPSHSTSTATSASVEVSNTNTQSFTVVTENGYIAQVQGLQNRLSKEASENGRLQRELDKVRKKAKSRYARIRTLENKLATLDPTNKPTVPTTCSDPENAEAIVEYIKQVINNAVEDHNENSHRAKTFFNLLLSMLVHSGLHYNNLRDSIVKVVGRYLRTNVFSPYKLLREMDLAGGKLSYAGVEVLRRCESNGTKGKNTIIPPFETMLPLWRGSRIPSFLTE